MKVWLLFLLIYCLNAKSFMLTIRLLNLMFSIVRQHYLKQLFKTLLKTPLGFNLDILYV